MSAYGGPTPKRHDSGVECGFMVRRGGAYLVLVKHKSGSGVFCGLFIGYPQTVQPVGLSGRWTHVLRHLSTDSYSCSRQIYSFFFRRIDSFHIAPRRAEDTVYMKLTNYENYYF